MTPATQNSRSINGVDSQATPGRMVAVARESKGISQTDLAQRLRLDTKVIRHLELDNFEQLPGPTFTKGYLRSIANELGLEIEPLLEAYKNFANEQDEPTLADFESRPPPQASSNSFIVRAGSYGLAITSFLLIIFWWQSNDLETNIQSENGEIDSTTTHTNTPLPYEFDQITHSDSPYFQNQQTSGDVTTDESSSANRDEEPGPEARLGETQGGNEDSPDGAEQSAMYDLSLSTTAESWVEIYDVDSKRLYFGMANARAPIKFTSDKPLNLLIGNTPTVKLTINGEPIDLEPFSNDGVAKFKFP